MCIARKRTLEEYPSWHLPLKYVGEYAGENDPKKLTMAVEYLCLAKMVV